MQKFFWAACVPVMLLLQAFGASAAEEAAGSAPPGLPVAEEWRPLKARPTPAAPADEGLSEEGLRNLLNEGGNITLGAPGPDGLPRQVVLPKPVIRPARVLPPAAPVAPLAPSAGPSPSEQESNARTDSTSLSPAEEAFGKLFSFRGADWNPLNPNQKKHAVKEGYIAVPSSNVGEPIIQRKALPIRHTFLPSPKFTELQAVDADESIHSAGGEGETIRRRDLTGAARIAPPPAEKSDPNMEIIQALERAVREVGAQGVSLFSRKPAVQEKSADAAGNPDTDPQK